MELETPYYRLFLQAELDRRCRTNPRYSLRAFARAIAIDPSSLSKILSGKMALSPRAATTLVERLACTPEQQRLLFDSLGDEMKRQRIGELEVPATPPRQRTINDEEFAMLADWYHMAILELTELETFRADARWIASQLGIGPTEARLAVERLLRTGLLVEKDGRLRQTAPDTTTNSRPFTSAAQRLRQKQVLEKAIHSLENDPIEERSMSCMTMAIDPDKIELARRILSEVNRHLCRVLSTGRKRRVYHLNIGLYPVQKKEVRV